MPLGDSSRAVEFHFLTECNNFLPFLPERHGQICIERGMKSEKKVSQTVNKTNMTKWNPHKSKSAHDLPYEVVANAFSFPIAIEQNNWTVWQRTFAVYLHSIFYILIQFMQRYESQSLLSLFQLFPATIFFRRLFFLTSRFTVQPSEESMKPSIRHIDFKQK